MHVQCRNCHENILKCSLTLNYGIILYLSCYSRTRNVSGWFLDSPDKTETFSSPNRPTITAGINLLQRVNSSQCTLIYLSSVTCCSWVKYVTINSTLQTKSRHFVHRRMLVAGSYSTVSVNFVFSRGLFLQYYGSCLLSLLSPFSTKIHSNYLKAQIFLNLSQSLYPHRDHDVH